MQENKEAQVETQAPMYKAVERTLYRNFMKIGRNDLCPCGSGKKYKRCCLIKPPVTSTESSEEKFNSIGDFANPKCKKCMGRGHLGRIIAEGKRFYRLCGADGCTQDNLKKYLAYQRYIEMQEARENLAKTEGVTDESNDNGVLGEGVQSQDESVGDNLSDTQRPSDISPTTTVADERTSEED